MTTNLQPQSNVKLSAAQIKMLNQIYNAGPTGIPSHTKYRKGEYRVNLHTARALSGRGFISWLNVGEPVVIGGHEFYATRLLITPEGCKAIGKTWNDMVKPHTSEETTEESEGADEDELPAKMPRETIMDADTAPVMDAPTAPAKTDYAVGDTVLFRYALSNCDTELFMGRIAGTVKESALWGRTIYIEPINDLNPYHVPPRSVSVDAIKRVIDKRDPIEVQRQIDAAYQAWEAAWLADWKSEKTARLSAEHDRLLDAYMASITAPVKAPQNAPQTPQNGATGDSEAVTVFAAAMTENGPQIVSSRRTGIVLSFDGTKGRIGSQGEIYAFNTRNLKHTGMAIKAGDTVTFEPRPSLSIERGGMPGAALIIVDGYVAPQRTVYTPNANIVNDVQAAKQATRETRKKHSTFKQQSHAANLDSIKRVMGGGL